MADSEVDLLRSSLDLLVLKALSWGPMHGYGISEWIESATLETHHLSRFRDCGEVVEHFGDPSNVVLKPIDDYHARGVFIRPSTEELERVFG